jgi:hypothetical protein
VTGAASAVRQTTALLNASVNPLGEPVSSCRFEYGPSTSYGASAPCAPEPGSGGEAVEVSAAIGGLTEYRTYHFRIVAANQTGTSFGADRTFSTLSGAPDFGRCTEVTLGTGRFANNICTKSSTAGRYAWRPGAAGVHFTLQSSSTTATLETVKHSRIVCKTVTGSGDYTGRATVGDVALAFEGCERLGVKCTSTLAPEGQIVTNVLEGALGVVQLGLTSATNKIGLELYPPGRTGSFMELSCGIIPVEVRGSVIVRVVTNKLLAVTTLKYSETGGKQHPERFLGEPAAILETSFGGGAFEQSGMKLEAIQTNGEAVETNSVA